VNVVDSSGWLQYFGDGPNAAHFAGPLAKAGDLIGPAISVFEVFQPVRPRSRLSVVRALIVAGKLRITASAIAGAAQRGLDRAQMLAVLLALTPTDFHKSMTTYVDHTIRQEVYRPLVSAGRVSVKLTVDDELLIVSFKEL